MGQKMMQVTNILVSSRANFKDIFCKILDFRVNTYNFSMGQSESFAHDDYV